MKKKRLPRKVKKLHQKKIYNYNKAILGLFNGFFQSALSAAEMMAKMVNTPIGRYTAEIIKEHHRIKGGLAVVDGSVSTGEWIYSCHASAKTYQYSSVIERL